MAQVIGRDPPDVIPEKDLRGQEPPPAGHEGQCHDRGVRRTDETVEFFESFYASASDDLSQIPWARLSPRPLLVRWLDAEPPAEGTPALVVACGLGDDAEELARRGCVVVAFDVSPTAIDVARRRFPHSRVSYRVADLFDLPLDWRERFQVRE